MTAKNRRRHRRWAGNGLACHVTLPDGSKVPGMLVENVSLSGLFLRTSLVLPVGALISIELVRRGLKKLILVNGRIVSCVTAEEAASRRTTPGLGVHFAPYGPDVERRLLELLEVLSTAGAQSRTNPPLPEEAPSPGPDSRDPRPFAVAPIPLDTPKTEAPQARAAQDAALRTELQRANEEVERQRKLVASLHNAIAALRGELLRLEQDNAELTARLSRYES